MKLHIDSKTFTTKPSGREIGGIKSRLKKAIVDVTISDIAEAIKSGQTLQPAVTPFSEASRAAGKKGTVDSDFASQTVFMIDVDNEENARIETIENADMILTMFDVEPAIIYETFSSTEEHPKFRVLIVCDEEITDRGERDTIVKGLLEGFAQADKSCTNADRIFFGTDKGLAVYRPEATVKKSDLLGLAETFLATHTPTQTNPETSTEPENEAEEPSWIIPKGHREQAMFDEANKLLTRFGDTTKTLELYEKFVERLEVIPGEPDPPQAKARYVFDRCRRHYHNVIEKDPKYKTPEEFESKTPEEFESKPPEEFESDTPEESDTPITNYAYLAKVYKTEHTYIVGVQHLAKGGLGNDQLYEYKNGVWIARSEEEVKRQLSRRVQSTGKTPDPHQIDKPEFPI